MGITAKAIKKHVDKHGALPSLKDANRLAGEEKEALVKALGDYRPVMLDLECTALNASFGYILCGCLRPAGGKTLTYRIDDYPGHKKAPWDDKQLVIDISKALDASDYIITWNGAGYDIPFAEQRLAVHGLPRIRPLHHTDLLPIARKKLRMHSNRLDAVAETLDVETSKTGLKPAVWQRAACGDRDALNYVVDHCIADVKVLEEVFVKMKDFIHTIYRKD